MPGSKSSPPPNYSYLDGADMQSGDILLPRLASVDAIVSNSDSISLLDTAISLINQNPPDQLSDHIPNELTDALKKAGDTLSAAKMINIIMSTKFSSNFDLILFLINALPKIEGDTKFADEFLRFLEKFGYIKASEVEFYILWIQIKKELQKLPADDHMTLSNLKKNILEKINDPDTSNVNQAIFNGHYVGHCAIVEKVGGVCWIIESSHTHGRIRSIPYSDWQEERRKSGALIWHGRFSKANGSEICRIAHRYRMLDKKYAIFDSQGMKFDLSTDEAKSHPLDSLNYIYCSELIYTCLKEIKYEGLSSYKPSKELPMITPKDLTLIPGYEWKTLPQSATGEHIPYSKKDQSISISWNIT